MLESAQCETSQQSVSEFLKQTAIMLRYPWGRLMLLALFRYQWGGKTVKALAALPPAVSPVASEHTEHGETLAEVQDREAVNCHRSLLLPTVFDCSALQCRPTKLA